MWNRYRRAPRRFLVGERDESCQIGIPAHDLVAKSAEGIMQLRNANGISLAGRQESKKMLGGSHSWQGPWFCGSEYSRNPRA